MKLYSQNDSLWKKKPLGNSALTIGSDGCVITCFAMMTNLRPDQVNNLLKAHGAFDQSRVIWDKSASALGLLFDPNVSKSVYATTLAVTNHYANQGFPTHYFILMPDGSIMDPLDGVRKNPNPYNITSYRNISAKGDNVTEDQWVALALPEALLYWEAHHHTATREDIASIEGQLRQVYQGQLNYSDLLATWAEGQ